MAPLHTPPALPEFTPRWFGPVVMGLGALSLVATLGLRSSQRNIAEEAQWQEPAGKTSGQNSGQSSEVASDFEWSELGLLRSTVRPQGQSRTEVRPSGESRLLRKS